MIELNALGEAGPDLMLSVVIATENAERTLVPTLAALVPGATAGIVREVIVADAGSSDATALIADAAGCRIDVTLAPLGHRLRQAAARARDMAAVPAPGRSAGLDLDRGNTALHRAR